MALSGSEPEKAPERWKLDDELELSAKKRAFVTSVSLPGSGPFSVSLSYAGFLSGAGGRNGHGDGRCSD
jgi:hypothetical protein